MNEVQEVSTPKKMPKKILLGVTASIALYKSCDLVRTLTKLNFDVHVAMTRTAAQWISPILFASLSGNPVISDNAPSTLAMPHIDLRKQLDLFIIAPASADIIARAATGRANDIITATLLSYTGKRMIAPAMNPFMFAHPATQKNIETLESYQYQILKPESGTVVCGDSGEGKMMAVEKIVKEIQFYLHESL